jgi:hypothetical protein
MNRLCHTNTQVSLSGTVRSERALTLSGANREVHEDTNNEEDNVPGTPRPSCKWTFQDLLAGEDKNMEPEPGLCTHPSNWPHAANRTAMSICFMTDSKTNCDCNTESFLIMCAIR